MNACYCSIAHPAAMCGKSALPPAKMNVNLRAIAHSVAGNVKRIPNVPFADQMYYSDEISAITY
jgi:hypothetical protein